jgi:hypothetical protein
MAFLATAAWNPPVHAKRPKAVEPEQAIDVSAIRDQFRVFQAESGQILVFVPFGEKEMIFWGSPQGVLNQQQARGYFFRPPEVFDYSMVDRRYSRNGYSLIFRNGAYFAECGEDKLPLQAIDEETGREMLDGARFLGPHWKRHAHFLARDNYGVYYFVDKALRHDDIPPDESTYRVYIGWKTEMLLSPLSLVAQDSVGEVYGMTNGNRRIVINDHKGRFFDGDEVRELHTLDLFVDFHLMYIKGGVYGEVKQGTPCDTFWPTESP